MDRRDEIIKKVEDSLASAYNVLSDPGHDGRDPEDAVTYLYDALVEVLKWLQHERTFGR